MEGDVAEAEASLRIALERMERLGIVQSVVWLLPQLAELAYHSGDWSKADELLERYARLLESMPGTTSTSRSDGIRARMASARAGAPAGELWERALISGRTVKDPQALVPTLSGYARFLLENGRPEEARRAAR